MSVKFSNNATTELASSIGTLNTSITVVDASKFPILTAGDYTYVTLDTDTASPIREIVRVTAISGNVLTVTRGQDGTSPASFAAGTKVELRLTAALLNDAADITSADVTSALGYTPYNATNPAGYTTNVGTVTSVSGTGTVSGLTLTGSVTSSGSLTLGGTLSLTSGNVTTGLGYTPYNATNPSGYLTDAMRNRGSVAQASVDSATLDGFYTQNNPGDSDGVLVFNSGGSLGPLQMRFKYTGLFEFRNKTDSANWNSWKQVLHSGNYNDYAPSKTGTGASGTWGISITGTARGVGTSDPALGAGGLWVTTGTGLNVARNNTAYLVLDAGNYSSYALPIGGGTLTGTLYFTDTTNGLSKSGGRLTVRSESTDNVANFAGYGLYLPVSGATAGLYVESPIEARSGLRIGNGAGSGTITVGADTSETASRLVQRDSSGGIFGTYIRARKNQTAGDYTTAAIWAESYGNTATGIAFHISGNVGKFLEMRTNGLLYFNSDLLLHSGNYSSYALPLSGGTLTGAIYVGTTGSASATRALRVGPSGGSPASFGSYTGSWRSTIEIWDNAATRMLHLTPPDGENYNWSSIKSVGAGLRIDVGGSGGTNAIDIGANGVANFPQGLQQGGNQVLHAGNYSSYSAFSGLVTSSGNNGFANATYFGAVRNPIWSFGNASSYGISYYQGSAGRDGIDTITLHPNGSTTATGATFATNSNNAFVNNNVVLHAANYNSYALPLSGGTISGAIRASNITAGGSTNTDANLGVQGTTHLTGTIYYGGAVGNFNSWSSLSTSSSGTHTFSGSRFVFDRYGYGSQPLIDMQSGSITFGQPAYAASGITVNDGSANGKGINLYSGSPTSPDYGLFFAQTGNFGTYGAVSADWATYFTMNSTPHRGWIFREHNSLGNVAAISNQGNMTLRSHFEQGNNIARPNVSWSASSTSTGMVIFYLPGTTANYGMVHMVFDIYEYNGNAVSTVVVGGHNWSTSWYNTGCSVVGQCGKSVRLGVKDGRFCVVFGTSGSSWEYGTIVLRKIHNGGFYDNIMNMVGDWSSTQTTTESFTNITGDLRNLRTPAALEVGTIGYAYQSFRSPIFYDYDNTGYYVDPASTSNLNVLAVQRAYAGYDAGVTNSFSCSEWFRSSGNSGWYNATYGGGIYMVDSTWVRVYNSKQFLCDSIIQSQDSVRGPIFYDSNNTGYYVDPASSSILNTVYIAGTIRNNGSVAEDDNFGLYFDSGASTAYAIYRESGGWSGTYPDLRIAFHTGIKIGANASYQGVRFYTDYDMSSQVMSVNNASDALGGGNVYVNNNLQAGSSLRAPVFYDSDNTGYYLDPTSTTSLRTVGDWRADSASWTGEFSGKIQYHSSIWYFQAATGWQLRNSGGSQVMFCDSSGNVTFNGNVTAYSDRRLKENVRDLTGAQTYLDKIAAKRFTWKDDGCEDIGFIAQDVEAAGLTEFVLETADYDPNTESTSDPFKTLDYGRMVSVLWQAVKEQKTQITAMSAEINSLKERLH